jgi:hypothetical protein
VIDLLLEDRLRRALHAAGEGRDYALVMLVPENGPVLDPPAWRLIVSAPWLERELQDQESFVRTVRELLGDQAKKIAAISILAGGDRLVKSIVSVFSVEGGGHAEIGDIRIGDVAIRKAILLQSGSG